MGVLLSFDRDDDDGSGFDLCTVDMPDDIIFSV